MTRFKVQVVAYVDVELDAVSMEAAFAGAESRVSGAIARDSKVTRSIVAARKAAA